MTVTDPQQTDSQPEADGQAPGGDPATASAAQPPSPPRRRLRRFLQGLGVFAALVVAYLASGIYFVAPTERGVVRWFGRIPEPFVPTQPGMNYALPWPFCKVDTPKVTDVRRVVVGLTPEQREAIARGDTQAMLSSPTSDLLTGDVNILKATMVVQYQLSAPADYLFKVEKPDRLLKLTLQSILIEELASQPVDQALTTGKTNLQLRVLERGQTTLDNYGCGIDLISANLEAIEPPQAVIRAFQDVVDAKKEGETSVSRAHSRENQIIRQAESDALTGVNEAESYATTRLSNARGQVDRFISLLTEYRRNPAVFRTRLYLQTMQSVLPEIRTYLLDEVPGKPATRIKILETPAGS